MFDTTVGNYLNLQSRKGLFGVEIEAEFKIFHPHIAAPPMPEPCKLGDGMWNIVQDGSLRGSSAEFVFKKPLSLSETGVALFSLQKDLEIYELEIFPSHRCGVHIHINMQNSNIRDLYRFLMVYYALETVLVNGCGDNRQGNLFCLRNRDANYLQQMIVDSVNHEDLYELRSEDLRYSALNIQSLFKYGSVELRTLSTPKKPIDVLVWCEILKRLKDYSEKMGSCMDFIQEISGVGPVEWALEVLGEDHFKMLKYDGMEQDILSDIREVQYTCFELSRKGI